MEKKQRKDLDKLGKFLAKAAPFLLALAELIRAIKD